VPAVHEEVGKIDSGGSASRSGLVWIGRRLAGEAGQDLVEYAGVLVLVAAIIAAVGTANLSGSIARAVSCEIKQIIPPTR